MRCCVRAQAPVWPCVPARLPRWRLRVLCKGRTGLHTLTIHYLWRGFHTHIHIYMYATHFPRRHVKAETCVSYKGWTYKGLESSAVILISRTFAIGDMVRGNKGPSS